VKIEATTKQPQHDAKETGNRKTLNDDNVTGLLLSYKLSTCKRKRIFKYVTQTVKL